VRLAHRRRSHPLLLLYRGLGHGLSPLVRLYLQRRRQRGKEHPDRWPERLGRTQQARPAGRLLWLHAASIGEAQSLLPLLERLRNTRPDWHLLMTTGTVTSAKIMAERLPLGVMHQFVPVDLPAAVSRFYQHWRPDAALWVESELWPNLVLEAGRRGVPLGLLNGRMSAASVARWQRFPGLAKLLLGQFHFILAQSPADQARFQAFGVSAACLGNLKFAALPLPVDDAVLADLRRAVGSRPLWLAASTHPGEEILVAEVHRRVAVDVPGLITVIVPRHPQRGVALATELTAARRSAGDALPIEGGLYLADTLGELGLWYRLAPFALIGGSLVPHGGQNPLEPARLGCAVVHGPHMFNFATIVAGLQAASASRNVADVETLTQSVRELLAQPAQCQDLAQAGKAYADGEAAVLERVAAKVEAWLDPITVMASSN